MLLSWCISTATHGEAGGMQMMGNRPTTTRERFTSGERHTERRDEEEVEGKGGAEDTQGRLKASLLKGETEEGGHMDRGQSIDYKRGGAFLFLFEDHILK